MSLTNENLMKVSEAESPFALVLRSIGLARQLINSGKELRGRPDVLNKATQVLHLIETGADELTLVGEDELEDEMDLEDEELLLDDSDTTL